MASKRLTITNDWQQISSGETVALQNLSTQLIEVASGQPDEGFIIPQLKSFEYTFGESLYARTLTKDSTAIITIDTNE